MLLLPNRTIQKKKEENRTKWAKGFPQTMSLGQVHAKTDMPAATTTTTIMLSTISMPRKKKKG